MVPNPYTYSSNSMNSSNNMFESEMPISSIVTPDFVGVILAGTPGARLYPLTVTDEDEDELMTSVERGGGEECDEGGLYKHLLPVAGTPIICHLLHNLWESGLEHAIVTISSKDQVTSRILKETWKSTEWTKHQQPQSQSRDMSFVYRNTLKVTLLPLPLTCAGSSEALVYLSESFPNTFASSPPLLVMPGDLILQPSSSVLSNLANAHRKGLPMVAATVLLSDVGEEDENGLPLKESSKAKKGGVAREDEDIEFIAVAKEIDSHDKYQHHRIMLKQSKYHVEEDEQNTGNTPKLVIPKFRFHQAQVTQMTIRMDLSDVHVYAISSWVLKLLAARPSMKEVQKEVLPLLVSRQFRSKGIASAFPQCTNKKKGNNPMAKDSEKANDLLDQVLTEFEEKLTFQSSFDDQAEVVEDDNTDGRTDSDPNNRKAIPFSVSAHVLSRPESKLTLRACTIPSYLYACREMVAFAVKTNMDSTNSNKTGQIASNNNKKTGKSNTQSHKLPCLDNLRLDSKNNSMFLAETTLGDKVQVKSCTIGKNVKIGNRCRLNNVVVMDNAVIGDNCVLQNSVVSSNCTVGDNCNLNDCQLGPGASVSSGTKTKAESFIKQ